LNKPPPNNTRIWIWIIAILGVFAIIGGVLGPIVGHALDTPFGRGFKKGFLGALTGDPGGSKTPAEKAVAKAGKCQGATVVSGEDAAKDIDASVPLDLDFVVCILPALAGAEPSCDDLARTFSDAAHPSRRFMIIVKRLLAGDELICQRTYTPGGEMITDHLKK
jgi:hypothetical protein